jgi:Ser/Thr protein kinase RdoA (MazF antagonist)
MLIGPTKWREPSIDPLSIPMSNGLRISEIVGYPHAGNDVFACVGLKDDQPVKFYLKVARHRDADLANEAAALDVVGHLGFPVPSVLSFGQFNGKEYLAISQMVGQRLSALLLSDHASYYRSQLPEMLREMGRSIGRIHSLPLQWRPVRERQQHKLPLLAPDVLLNPDLQSTLSWLSNNVPSRSADVFVHGDHHYANVLWSGNSISAILDWELCGCGWREFDLAWATTLRPSQQFLRTPEEVKAVLDGYHELTDYDPEAFLWCRQLIFCHFLNIKSNWEDQDYREAALKAMKNET